MNDPITRKYVIYVENEHGDLVGQPVHFETTAEAITDLGNVLDTYIAQFVTPLIEEAGSINRLIENLKKLPDVLEYGDLKDEFPTIINKNDIIGWNRIPLPPGYIELTLTDDTVINGMTAADVTACSTTAAATTEITVGGQTFRKDQVKEIKFGKDFDLISLHNFGRNFINLTTIAPIPEGVTGHLSLCNFLQGCEKFNQPITIPDGVTGYACLENFLTGCKIFNQPITIPEGVEGDYCLNYFLYGCKAFNQPIMIPEGVSGKACLQSFLAETAFNQPITIPEGITGEYCLCSFLSNCSKFNHPITIPDSVTGLGCLAGFLKYCTSFNQPLTIPEGVTGNSCLNYFLQGCTSFNQPITIPEGVTGSGCLTGFLNICHGMASPITVNNASGLTGDDNTLSTYDEFSQMYENGILILGNEASNFKRKFPDRHNMPFRKLRILNPFELILDDDRVIYGETEGNIYSCSTTSASTTTITMNGQTFRKDQVKKIKFGEGFNPISLNNFGRNFTNLTEIDPIPKGITGDYCLQNFLYGCTSFNQAIEIPDMIDGYYCLNGFLSECTSFNQPITIPEGITGSSCIRDFLYNCHSMVSPVTIIDASTLNGSNNTLGSNNNSAPMYVQGIPIIGDGAAGFKTKLLNRDTSPFRKLI